MDTPLQQFILRVQQTEQGSPERQAALQLLCDCILSRRSVGRPFKGQPPVGIYREVVMVAEQKLQDLLEQKIDAYELRRSPPEDWSRSLRDQILQEVLTPDRLQQLAIAAQQCQPRTDAGQYAYRELVSALLASDKLMRPAGLTKAVYQDVVNQTLGVVCQQLPGFDPQRGAFMPWVNFRVKTIAQDLYKAPQDSYTRASHGRIIRLSYELSAIVKRVSPSMVQDWLRLWVKSWMTDTHLWTGIAEILTVMAILATLLHQNPGAGHSLLLEITQTAVIAPPRITAVEETQLEAIAQPDAAPNLIEGVRHYLETDPEGLCQKHIRHHPQATFQRIALSYLDGVMWKDLAKTLGVDIPSLSTFYQRNLKAIAPHIRKFIEENF